MKNSGDFSLFLYTCKCVPNQIGVVKKTSATLAHRCTYCGKFCRFIEKQTPKVST